jgi:GMP synthase PP-ATPase subunit
MESQRIHRATQGKHSKEVKNRKVFMLVSGGVDSSVAFALSKNTRRKQRLRTFVDTGLMRRMRQKR